MKPVRVVLIGVAVLAVLLVVAVILAFSSPVQTWAARRALAAQPDTKGEIGRVSAGLQSVELSQIRIEKPGLTFTAPHVKVDLPVLSAASENVEIRRFEAKGWTLDLTAPGAAAPTKPGSWQRDPRDVGAGHHVFFAMLGLPPMAAVAQAQTAPVSSAPFEGIFKLLNLPVDLSLHEADVAGDIIFPTAPGQPPGRAKLTLTGGKLGSGSEGRFKLVVDAKLPDAGAPVSQVSINGDIRARMDTPRSFQQLGMEAEIVATGTQFPNGARLRGDLAANRTAQAESYALEVKSLHGSAPKSLVSVKADYAGSAKSLAGTWALDVRNADLAPFALGRTLPDFTAAGQGTLSASASLDRAQASGKLAATLESLATLRPELAALGSVRVDTEFDVVHASSRLRVEKLMSNVAAARPVASVQVLQPVEYDLTTREVRADNSRDLLRLSLQGLPVAWVQPFAPDLAITGNDVTGEFTARTLNGGVSLKPAAPIVLANLSVSQKGVPLVRAVDVSVTSSADYLPQGWQADVTELSVKSGGESLLTASLKAGQTAGANQPLKATGTYSANLPALLRQPVATQFASLTSGRAAGTYSAEVLPTLRKIGLTLEATELAGADRKALPKVLAQVRADLKADGGIAAEVPVVVEAAGRKSDVSIVASVTPSGKRQAIDAAVTSQEAIYVEDFQALRAAMPPPSAAPAKPASPKPDAPPPVGGDKPTAPAMPPGAPEVAPWDAITGPVRLSLKKVVYSTDVPIQDITAALNIQPDAIRIENAQAMIGAKNPSQARVSGQVTFDPAAAADTRYRAEGSMVLPQFNPGPFMRLLAPDKDPLVEGLFDINGQFSGAGRTLEDLAMKATGGGKLSSNQGLYRFLPQLTATLEPHLASLRRLTNMASGLSNGSSALGGLDFLKKASGNAEQVKKYLGDVDEMSKTLSSIRFDQFNVEVVKETASQIVIKDLTVISPHIRLVGAGLIKLDPGRSFYRQPLSIEISMGARDEFADLLSRLKVLRTEKDNLGYAQFFSPIALEGDLLNISYDRFLASLSQQLVKAGLGDGVPKSSADRLRGLLDKL